VRPLLSVVALLCAASCGAEEPPPVPYRASYVLTRVAIDPITELGHGIYENDGPEAFGPLLDAVPELQCDGGIPTVIDLKGLQQGERVEGELGVYYGGYTGTEGEPGPCSDGAVYGPLWIPLLYGPFVLEGDSADAWVSSASVPLAVRPYDSLFTGEWLRLTGDVVGPEEARRVRGGRLIVVWSASFLHGVDAPPSPALPDGGTMLDVAVGVGLLSPDVDRDGDGLEILLDTDMDHHVDLCIDADGTEHRGLDCPMAPGINDGFELVVLFRVATARLIE
jgi:hypothetical protein